MMNPRLALLIFVLAALSGLLPVQSALAAGQAPEEKQETLAPVLPPEQFFGPAAMAYAAAKKCPHVCNKLFCYCGCDITDNHKTLLDCFTSIHGVDCHICQEEAMIALRLVNDNEPIAAIQKAVDEDYARMYPFKEESAALKHYKALRLWHPVVNSQTSFRVSEKLAHPGTCCSEK